MVDLRQLSLPLHRPSQRLAPRQFRILQGQLHGRPPNPSSWLLPKIGGTGGTMETWRVECDVPMQAMSGQPVAQDASRDHRVARIEPCWRSQSIVHQSPPAGKSSGHKRTRQRLARTRMGPSLLRPMVGELPWMVETQECAIIPRPTREQSRRTPR